MNELCLLLWFIHSSLHASYLSRIQYKIFSENISLLHLPVPFSEPLLLCLLKYLFFILIDLPQIIILLFPYWTAFLCYFYLFPFYYYFSSTSYLCLPWFYLSHFLIVSPCVFYCLFLVSVIYHLQSTLIYSRTTHAWYTKLTVCRHCSCNFCVVPVPMYSISRNTAFLF